MSSPEPSRRSLPPAFERLVLGAIILPLALAFVLGGVFIWQVSRLLAADRRLQHSDQIIATANTIQKLLVDMETGLRAYVITGKDGFLQPYRDAQPQIDGNLRELSTQTAGNPDQTTQVLQLVASSNAWRAYAQTIWHLVQHNDAQARSVQITSQGKSLMDSIRSIIDRIINVETHIRDQQADIAHYAAMAVVLTSVAFSMIVGIILAAVSRRQLYAAADTYTDALHRAQDREQENARLLASERAARSTAENANRMKDEFLATLSHELRTPLNAILGWAHLLRGQQRPSDLIAGLETIERNARMQTQLIEDLLDMSRIVSGKLRIDIQRISPISFIESAIATVAPAAEAKGIRIEKILDPLAGPISGDPNRLQQVVWNLLSNAVKFTPKNGKIQIILERVNSHIEIVIADTGQGVSPEFLPYVFDRFRQADSTSTRRVGGLGLGLSIVKQLVELHGGAVRVKSPGPGKGATFTVELPVTAAHSNADDYTRVHPTASIASQTQFKPELLTGVKVLVVDDEPDARQLIKRLIEESGAKVLLANSAEEGLTAVQRDQPDILLSDIGMPDMDGYRFIKEVRSLPPARGGAIPAIALTAFARSEDRTRSLMAGYHAHLSKPVEPAELLATLVSVSRRTSQNNP